MGMLDSRERHVKMLRSTGCRKFTGCTIIIGAVVIMVPQNACLHFFPGSVPRRSRQKKKVGVRDQKEPEGPFFENQGFPFLGLSHLFVTSIWMMKLERKTRKVQAA